MKPRLAIIRTTILMALLAPSVCRAQDIHSQASALNNVDSKLRELGNQGFSGALLVKKGDSTLLNKAYGTADCGKRVRRVDDVSDLGSVTKSFTAVAILKLVVQGQVELGDMIGKYLPDVPPDK